MSAKFARIQNPVEYVVGTVKQTGEHEDPYEYGLYHLPQKARLMGQQLLNPPTVEGWHTGREWIDSALLMERVNFAVERLGNAGAPGVKQMIERIAAGREQIAPEQLLDAALYELGALELISKSRDVILEEFEDRDAIPCDDVNREQFEGVALGVFQLIAATREYQLS